MMVKNHLNTYSEKKGRTTKLVIPEKNENNVNSQRKLINTTTP